MKASSGSRIDGSWLYDWLYRKKEGFIVLDLEWNQSPSGKSGENRDIPFEIIEIGALKLDQSMEILDCFHEYIRPQIYRRLHFKIQELTNLSIEKLQNARCFPEVIRDFVRWRGEDCVVCTWGSMDLEELQKNIDFYHLENPFPRPLLFYDIQKLFSRAFEDGHSRKSLEYAVEFLRLQKSFSFHGAFEDSCYTAMIMRRLEWERVKMYLSVDCYRPPRSGEDEIYLDFPDYTKYVSHPFDTKEAAIENRAVTATPCCICGRMLRKRIRWFPSGSRTYDCLSWCPDHGCMTGKIRLKKTADDRQYYAVRILRPASEEDVSAIREKREHLRVRRKIRRTHKQEA